MAIENQTGAAAGLHLDTDLKNLNDTCITGITSIHDATDGGEAFIVEFRSDGGRYLGLTCDINSGPVVSIRLSWDGGWEELSSGLVGLDEWFGWGIDCAGVGSNQLTIMLSAGQSATPLSFTKTIGGSSWNPDDLRLMFNTALARGITGKIQNVKYGDRGLNAAQMHAEAWNLTNQNSGDWTPTITEMVTGDLTAQREGFSAVNASGNLAVAAGYFVDTGGSTGTVTVTSATISGDSVAIGGTFTSDAETQTITVELVKAGVITLTGSATIAGSNWSCSIDNIPAGTYTVRARIVDGLGSATHTYGSTIEFIGLSGSDEIPYLYTTTAILAVPNTLSLPVGGTVTVKTVDQNGDAISGAIVQTGSSGRVTAPGLTDLDGNVVITGVSEGTTNLMLRVVNQAGATLTANVPVTVGPASGSVVTVSPATATIGVNQTQQFTSVITGGGSTTWTVESGGGSIDSDGLYTAPSTATVAVIRGAKTGSLSDYDESTVTVVAEAQSSIGGSFLGDANLSVSPGQSFSWRIKVQVDNAAYQGAVVTPVAVPGDRLSITQPLATSADGTTTITARVLDNVATGVDVDVTFEIVAGDLSMTLSAVVSIADAPFGYLELRGRKYPRPYEQK